MLIVELDPVNLPGIVSEREYGFDLDVSPDLPSEDRGVVLGLGEVAIEVVPHPLGEVDIGALSLLEDGSLVAKDDS